MSTNPNQDRNSLLSLRCSPITLAEFFSGFGTIAIPQFQRAYSWEALHVDSFLLDVERCYNQRKQDSSKAHFFGAIVTCKGTAIGSSRPHILLVDGQQRIATIYMFLSILRSKYEAAAHIEPSADENPILATVMSERAKILSRQFEFTRDLEFTEAQELRKLTLCKADRQFFEQLLAGQNPDIERNSHKRLLDGYTSMHSFFTRLLENANTLTKHSRILEILYKTFLIDWSIVHLSFDNREHANEMFRVLNARGARVTETELLRARTLEAIQRLQQADIDDMSAIWDDILAGSELPPDDGLTYLYESIIGQSPSVGTADLDFESAFFPAISDTLNLTLDQATQTKDAIVSLQRSLNIVAKLANGTMPTSLDMDADQVSSSRLTALIETLKLTYCVVPLLLAAEAVNPKMFLTVSDILERFLFRYIVMCKGPVVSLKKILGTHSLLMRKEPHGFRTNDFTAALQELLDIHANDQIFEERIRALQYGKGENPKIRYLLIMHEHMFNWHSKKRAGAPKCADPTRYLDFKNMAIEHIHSQQPAEASELDLVTQSIGNLTIISAGENDALANKKFEEKKPTFAASHMALNREISEYDVWDKAHYDARLQSLVDRSLAIFSL